MDEITFTPAVDRALKRAAQIAAGVQAPALEPRHLLHALLLEPGRAYQLLSACGAKLAEFLDKLPPLPPAPTGAMPDMPLATSTLRALHRAHDLARDLGEDPSVGSEQLVLMLVCEDGELRAEMEDLGADVAALQERVFADLHGPTIPLDEPLLLDDPVAPSDVARILDAAANRTREGLRVVEDYCRFVLDDALLSRECKTLRHDLAGLLEALPLPNLLAARETLRDVGIDITTPREQVRESLHSVVVANLKRLQEALRSLEEFGKLFSEVDSPGIERLRYRAYTLERMLLLGAEARSRLADVRLCVLVTGEHCWGNLERTVREAIAGGAQMIQLREKKLADRDLFQRARQFRQWTRADGALLIVNDRPDVARLVEADGVHLGQEDLPVKEARRILGPDALIGVSTHNLEQVRQAVRDAASYIGVGPTFSSQTKGFDALAGLDFVRQATAETSLPAFAIGGIALANLREVLAAGARRVAVSAAVCRSETPAASATALRQLLDAAGK